MKATAFAPGHISGFFEPVYEQDMARTGSRGAGLSISLGAMSEVTAEYSTKQDFNVFINNKKSNATVTKLALRYLVGDSPIKVVVRTKYDLPFGQGFGMSASSAVSATYALAKIIGVSKTEALKASHFAEVKLRTGLGDVFACCFGGIEIRKEAGIPPWGLIEHIPGIYDLVLCVIGEQLDTQKILSDSSKINEIKRYGRYCTKRLLVNPSIETLFSMSQIFTKKTNLAEKNVQKAIEASSKYGMASMCMLGNSVFALGETNELCEILSSFGKVFVCSVDECGARVFKVKK